MKSEEQNWLQDCAQRLKLEGQIWIQRGMDRLEGFQRIPFHWRTSSLVIKMSMGLTLFRVWVFVGYLDSEHFDTFAHFQFSTGFYLLRY